MNTFKQYYNEGEDDCPEAAKDLDLNTKNRNATRDNHDYGPLNPSEPNISYWSSLAKKWKSGIEEAMKSRCGNCVAFDTSPRMKQCLPVADSKVKEKLAGELPGFNEEAEFGYCWMHHFKCLNARSCDTWAGGGPITDDKTSNQWQEKNK